MQSGTGRYFYFHDGWDEQEWVDLVAIEYESLIAAYPFAERLGALSDMGRLRVLDVGCGTAIFPTVLDAALPDDLHIECDLIDISPASLDQARSALERLEHFTPLHAYESAIEDLPAALEGSGARYQVIWAIHAFTTVEVVRMQEVFAHLLDLLVEGGILLIYQLTARSSYQRLHAFFREHHEAGGRASPYMQYEDTKSILDTLGARYEVFPLTFDHRVPDAPPERLEAYLRKCMLDPELKALTFFESLLPSFHEPQRGIYRFPQQVNLVAATKTSSSG